MMKNVNIVLFNNFTTLDAIGPTEVLSRLPDYFTINFYSQTGGPINGSGSVVIETHSFSSITNSDILVIPGGFGTRQLVNDSIFIDELTELALQSTEVLCVCTGSALLARTGLLDHKIATSNKLSWEWVIQQNSKVKWVREARWLVDGKYYTSAGVSAGIDMTLGYIAINFGMEIARKISISMEYVWNQEIDNAKIP